jgi:hypothetical protein
MKIFDNPMIKNLALSQFSKMIADSGKHGIYIYIDDKGEVQADYFDEHPNLTILKNQLKQQTNG